MLNMVCTFRKSYLMVYTEIMKCSLCGKTINRHRVNVQMCELILKQRFWSIVYLLNGKIWQTLHSHETLPTLESATRLIYKHDANRLTSIFGSIARPRPARNTKG
jgi:hypothetical protein